MAPVSGIWRRNGRSGRNSHKSDWQSTQTVKLDTAPLTLDGLQSAVLRARRRLAKNPELITGPERLGRERALIYKTFVLTGLRKGELASITVGQLELAGPMPRIVLDAADEKNRQGSTIPLRADLATDLNACLSDVPVPQTLRLNKNHGTVDPKQKIFTVPAGLVRILNGDLSAAGIDNADERGRTIDVHARRTSFGTLLSKGGVAPRTAQAAMRHSTIDLTMNTCTDPKLLDVQGALNALQALDLNPRSTIDRQTMRATGTDDRDARPDTRHSVIAVAPNSGKTGQTVSFAVHSPRETEETGAGTRSRENHKKQSEKASSTGFVNKAFGVERTGVEPPTSALRTHESTVLSGNLSDLTTSDIAACTNACTSEPKKRRKQGSNVGASIDDGKAEVTPDSVDTDFAAALRYRNI